jgi:hypothetical protein
VTALLGKSTIVPCSPETVARRPRPESTRAAPAEQSVTIRQSTSYEGRSKTAKLSATHNQSTSYKGSLHPAGLAVQPSQELTSYELSSSVSGAVRTVDGPSYRMSVITRLVSLTPCTFHQPSILFEVTTDAAAHNWDLLKEKKTMWVASFLISLSQL